MKKLLLLFIVSLLLPIWLAFSQTLNDYISAVKGDTLVIKDYYDMNNQTNSLYYVLLLDSVDVPEGRVYELKENGYYPNWRIPVTSTNHATVIVGADTNIVVNNKNESSSPPLICNYPAEVDPASVGIILKGDLIIKNCKLIPADISGTTNWTFAVASAPNLNLVFENCLFEHTLWTFVSIYDVHCNVTFRDCYFVNMSGYYGRCVGGVFDCNANHDTLLVENCTHVMAQGDIYSFKRFRFTRVIINHNTFVNCVGSAFMNNGYQGNFSLTNNLFINTNIYPLDGCSIEDLEIGDPDGLPVGLVNVNPYPVDSTDILLRKFLVQSNLVYWDPFLTDCDSLLNAERGNNSTCWKSQAIIMNSRTRDMFDDDIHYPYLVTDNWKSKLPNFTYPGDLFTTQIETIKDFVIEAADDTNTTSLPNWRLVNNGSDNFVNPDWPIPVDLSYSDPDLLTSGLGGYPLGDLNWFPTQKELWLVQRSVEYDNIHNALYEGSLIIAVQKSSISPTRFQLNQNFPNPFNPSTIISYQLADVSDVVLKVYDLLGREIAILVNEKQFAGTHYVHFEGSSLTSGVYLYQLQVNSYKTSKKMILIR